MKGVGSSTKLRTEFFSFSLALIQNVCSILMLLQELNIMCLLYYKRIYTILINFQKGPIN